MEMNMETREVAAEHADDWLDRALEDTFPASDPVAANRFD
jgi:hypothetical protein